MSEHAAPPLRTWRPMAAWTGAILLALGLIWFVAAVVVLPKVLRPRNEMNAIKALHQYAEAQTIYKKNRGTYADQPSKLSGLLPREIIAAWGPSGRPYQGYVFRELKTIGGQPIDWTCDFGISAIPAKHGHTGRRSFIMSTNGTPFGRNWGNQVDFFEDYPADMSNSPWMLGQLEDEG